MKVTFLGVGSAFSRKHGNSNILIESGSIKLLVDCSLVCSASLREYGLSLQDITHIFITHLHADHITGLEEIAFKTRLVYHTRPILLSTESLLTRLWNYSLRGGLEYVELTPGEAIPQTLEDFFDVQPLPSQEWVTLGSGPGLNLFLHPTNHVKGMESYGLMVEEPPGGREKRFLLSGDTKFDAALIARGSDTCSLILHDCQLIDSGENNGKGVHASYQQLQQVDPAIRRRMWLYHYGDTTLPDAVSDGFAGFITLLQSFTF
jgi:ribonuclease BN (tRNA processing enzyme)